MDEPSTILAVIDDLFFSTRVEDIAKGQGFAVVTVHDARAFHRALSGEQPALVIVDLGSQRIETIDLVREASHVGIPVLAFGPHVDKEAHQAARDAGARVSVTNSQLMRELPVLIRELAE